MELNNFNVRELSTQEKVQINGGSKLGAALKAAWDAVCYAVEWVVYKIEEWYYAKKMEYYNNFEGEIDPNPYE
jgi:hypothetical protein